MPTGYRRGDRRNPLHRGDAAGGTVTAAIMTSETQYALLARAAAIILCHNHPSGDPTPSADDRAVTEQLVAAGRLLDIPVLDHVIIGRGRYVSFSEAGLL